MLYLNDFNSRNWIYINLITIIPGVISLIVFCLSGSESPLYLLNNIERGFIVIEFMVGRILTDNEKIKKMDSIQRNKYYKLKSEYSE